MESGNLAPGVGRRVVDSHAPLGALEACVGHLRDPLESSITRTEIKDCGPVIRCVLGEGAGRAGRLARDIHSGILHGCVEGIAADDLVDMWRSYYAGVHERV